MGLEEELTNELRGTIEAAKARGYIPTYFLKMLDLHEGKEAAKRLLATEKIQSGLFRLYDLGLLKDSMEFIVLKEKYRSLFTEVELAVATERLEQLGLFE